MRKYFTITPQERGDIVAYARQLRRLENACSFFGAASDHCHKARIGNVRYYRLRKRFPVLSLLLFGFMADVASFVR